MASSNIGIKEDKIPTPILYSIIVLYPISKASHGEEPSSDLFSMIQHVIGSSFLATYLACG